MPILAASQNTVHGSSLPDFIFVFAVVAIIIYARYWYKHPSNIPESLKKTYVYNTVEWMGFRAKKAGRDPEGYEISEYEIVGYLKGRGLKGYERWRERNDVLRLMTKMNLAYEVNDRSAYVLSPDGKDLNGTLREAARMLRASVIRTDQAMTEAASLMGSALRLDARTASPENRQRAEGSAREIEDALKARDLDKLDRALKVSQIVANTLPLASGILHILGLGWP